MTNIVYGKTLRKKTSVVCHLVADLFPSFMTLSIGSISLQACYYEGFPSNNFQSKHGSFPLENFAMCS